MTLPYRSPPFPWLQLSLELINVVTLNPTLNPTGRSLGIQSGRLRCFIVRRDFKIQLNEAPGVSHGISFVIMSGVYYVNIKSA